MLTHTCALSDIDQKPNNYSFFIPRGIDYKNDNWSHTRTEKNFDQGGNSQPGPLGHSISRANAHMVCKMGRKLALRITLYG